MGGDTRSKSPAYGYPTMVSRPVGKQIHSIMTERLRQFTTGGQYQGESLLAKLWDGRAEGDDHVRLEVHSVPDLERPSFHEVMKHADFKSTHKGEQFGPSWSTHWFKVSLKVPDDLKDKEHLEFHWDSSSEALIYSKDGEPLQGLTGGERNEWIFPKSWRDGSWHTFYIEMACNGLFGNAPGGDIIQPPDPNKTFTLWTADIVAVNLEARGLFVDFWILGDAAREFPGDSWESHQALQICNDIVDAFIAGQGSQESIRKGRQIASRYLGHVNSDRVYESKQDSIVFAIGHCHIDTCWLWPWAETKRKSARSWANQCELMDRYPEHRFACSQAQQYKWLEQNYPPLYDRVKDKVKKGTFQPIGGSWVEHDTNMPSGESLVRQFLLGQRYFESRFGERSTTFWLPDTFGYSTQLPQICRLAGMSRFFTQKLSWNNINSFPHTTFNWVALDGSQVLCHMAPSETYTAEAHFGDVKRSVTQHKSMDQDHSSLLVFGKGDGGGGPTREHLEKLRRCRGLSDTTGLLPRVKMGDSVDDFFARLEERAAHGTEYVTWYGELYFELHRGTYTTQSNNKWNNRKTEILMHDVEMLATLASLKDKNYKYPKETIDDMWERICLCQFHDCLPGSSIEMCYDDSDKVYAEVWDMGEKALKKALSALGWKQASDGPSDTMALNLSPWERKGLLKSGKSNHLFAHGGLGAVATASKVPHSQASVKELENGVFQLTNNDLEVKVERGVITSLYDRKAGRQVLVPGQRANQFVIFDDKPLYWQAWDVEVYHLNSRRVLDSSESEVVASGPNLVSVKTKTQISEHSSLTCTISLAASSGDQPSAVTFDVEVDWHEKMQFLKVEFPVDVVNTEASYETQYGIIRRPTHYNTSWDMAKFEVCCHKWADLSEAGYGVSILNDSKYGFATCGKLMRLSLLRAPKAPDAHADMGHHKIRYAILPHAGALDHRTVRAAWDFNHPMRLVSAVFGDADEKILRAITLEGSPALVLDCIKRGEDDVDVSRGELPTRKGRSVILRIYDSLGGQASGRIRWDKQYLAVKKVIKTNVLEDDLEDVEMDGASALITLRAFEVATFRLQLKAE